jgi:hypothetical protein
MFEPIDTDSTDADQPLSDWLGKRLINNALALSERGWSGTYVWSKEVNDTSGVTAVISIPSKVSTHPEYFYSIPLILPPTLAQTEITVRLTYATDGDMDVAFWVNGQATSVTTLTDSSGSVATVELTIQLPSAQPIATRAALLLRSVMASTPEDSGNLTGVGFNFIKANTSVAPADVGAFHRAIVLDGSTLDAEGIDLPQTYHIIRADSASTDIFRVFPSVDPAIYRPADAPSGFTVEIYEIGTIQIYGLQVFAETASVRGMPTLSEVNAGEVVRAETIRRITKRVTDVQRSAVQVPWVGGVGGVARTTVLGAIPARFWGALARPNTGSDMLSTQVRARDGVRGVVVSVMYLADGDGELGVSLGGATATVFTLSASASTTQNRDYPGDPGTMHWRHKSYTRDQCSAQDIGFHGPIAPGFRGDTSRLALFSAPVFFASPPSAGSLVSVEVSVEPATRGKVYLAAVTVTELLDLESASSWPDVEPPSVLPYAKIRDESIAALVTRSVEAYETRLRIAHSEAADPLGTVFSIPGGTTILEGFEFTTSPDLPSGTVLRFTIDAENCTMTSMVDATTDSNVFTTRSVQTSDIAIASATTYTVRIDCTVTALSVCDYYSIHIEEIIP